MPDKLSKDPANCAENGSGIGLGAGLHPKSSETLVQICTPLVGRYQIVSAEGQLTQSIEEAGHGRKGMA
jgi:hypothetical protein